MNKKRVRQGEWNEALCFSVKEHPRTEIAAQFCRDHWNIFYISSKVTITIRSGILDQKDAESIAEWIAFCALNTSNPLEAAWRLKR